MKIDLIVLILVVVDNGIVLWKQNTIGITKSGLNPCCSGQWYRTQPYKTLLIINKLKSVTKQILAFLNRELIIH